MGKLLKFVLCFIAASGFAATANAFDVKFENSVSDQEALQACRQASSRMKLQPTRDVCVDITPSKIISELESVSYDLLGAANDNLKFHDYVFAREGGASRFTLSAMRERLPQNFPDGSWIAPPNERYVDLASLYNLAIRYELIRIDYGPHDSRNTYTFYSTGIFQAREQTANYRVENLGANFHFRYTVQVNGAILYDGFIVHSDTFTSSIVCMDPHGSVGHRGCEQGVGGQLKVNQVSDNFNAGFLAAGLLTRNESVFSDMTAYTSGDSRISETAWSSKLAAGPANTAQRPDLAQYATSFQLIEGGRATFQFKQLPLYISAVQRGVANTAGVGNQNTAKFLADQQQCTQVARSELQSNRTSRGALGFLAGAAGFGEAASIINRVDSVLTTVENLNGEALELANSCMRARGHSSIHSAVAADAAQAAVGSSAYVPYTSSNAGASANYAAPALSPPLQQGTAPLSPERQASTVAQTYPDPAATASVLSSPPRPAPSGSALSYANTPAPVGSVAPAANAAGISVVPLSSGSAALVTSGTSIPAGNPLQKLGEPIGTIDLVDMDFGFATMISSEALVLGDRLVAALPDGTRATFKVSKDNGALNYSLIVDQKYALRVLQPGFPVSRQ